MNKGWIERGKQKKEALNEGKKENIERKKTKSIRQVKKIKTNE